jgi:indole-3-glycerol phosphate synthase
MSTDRVAGRDSIIAVKRRQLEDRKKKTPIEAIRALASMQKRPLPLLNTVLTDDQVLLIGQIRYEAAGEDGAAYDPVGQAVRYARSGVDAIALFTDATIYAGGLDDLMFVSRAVQSLEMPVISQDYVFDEYQVVEARAAGAAGVVLTASLLDDALLRRLVSATQRNRMTAIVKVADEAELQTALSLSPQMLAISNRNPQTQAIDPERIKRLCSRVPNHIRVLVAGGLHALADIRQVVALGVSAVLIATPALAGDENGQQLQKILNRPIVAEDKRDE